ncbi:hypothetical protein C6P40_001429 [Pichia californica]|uniref:Flavin-containing monooxygenase n=1 Tax=Pichia californica TaxID=460514 RepID=A0A9P6WJI4_9ASCO|nr:hypothetical protein C6P42_001483 [[Candida] californica]KAG0688092.1 hypothetical protein C6P40_001429 [[Candida] californica]
MSIQNAIKSIAVIGAGPAGIACVNELVHTSISGISTLEKNIKPKNPAFEKIICFEQNSNIGGVWNFFKDPDPKLPPLSIIKSNKYNKPDEIFEKSKIPNLNKLKNTSFNHPYVTFSNKTYNDELKWGKNAAYKDLFTNIPEKFMRFSYTPYKGISKGKFLEPLISSVDVKDYLDKIIENYNLSNYFRVNSSIELIEKDQITGKWNLTIRHKPQFSKIEQWYTESFDAVILANGHCNVPFIPKIENLAEFVSKFPDVISHSKSFRNSNDFKNSNVLLCGSGTSSADLAQYLSPVAKSVTISQRSETVYEWIKNCFSQSPNIKFKPRIKKLLPESESVEFVDGTIGQYDHIILSTGYHYHFPMLNTHDDYVKIYNDNYESQSPINKIGNLYLYTFSTKDNTLATVGIPTIGLMFHAMEYSAAAVAGVFSGLKKLPNIEEQIKWDDSRTKIEKPEVPHRFQGFFTDKLQEQLLNPLFKFAPEGRTDPLTADGLNPKEVEASNPALVKAYLALQSGKFTSKDLLK